MAAYTKAECATIAAAWQAINELCSRTNWSDKPNWIAAEKLERKEVGDSARPIATAARAMICAGWLEGLEKPDTPARKIYHVRPGYLTALMLGVRHAVERRGDDYNGPLVEECAELCRAAVAANEAHTRRIIEG